MFKNTMLIVLLSMTCPALATAGPSTQQTTIETIKKSRGLGKWFGTIIPCILSLISTEAAIRMNKDKPDRKEVVVAAKFMRLLCVVLGCFFLDEWTKTDFKDWSFRRT